MHDQGGHGTTTRFEVGLQHHATGLSLDACGQLLDLGHQHDLLEQALDVGPLQRRDLDDDGVAAPGLGHEPALGQLLEDAGRVGVGPVHLVDGHDDRTSAALAWSMASMVWGMTPSSAATTRMTMSVAWPRGPAWR